MTVRIDGDTIVLSGICGVDEVEELLRFLSEKEVRRVDIAGAGSIHTALWQVLFMFRPTISGGAPGSFAVSNVIPNMRIEKPE